LSKTYPFVCLLTLLGTASAVTWFSPAPAGRPPPRNRVSLFADRPWCRGECRETGSLFPAGPASDSSPRRLRRKRNRKPDDL